MNLSKIVQTRALLVLVCAGFAVFGYLRLNDTSLYTDSTRYVIWGTSFAHARGFVDNTQPDPERYVVNAPLYSVILAPVMLFFPDSLLAAKIWTLMLGLCALALFFIWLQRRFGTPAALLGTFMLAANPLMLVMATEAMSEMCFVALVIGAMLLLERVRTNEHPLSGQSLWLLIILSLLPLLREVSIALVVAVLLVMFAQRQFKHAVWIVGGVVIVLGAWMIRNVVIVGIPPTSQSTNVNFIFGHFVTSTDSSILSELLQRVFVNVRSFYVFTVSLLIYPFPQPLIVNPSQLFRFFFRSISVVKYVLPFLVLPLMVTGMVEDAKRGTRAYVGILFMVLYSLIIILYPIQDARFLLPLLPFLIYFLVAGFARLATTSLARHRGLWVASLAIAVGIVTIPNLDCDLELIRTNWRYQHSSDQLYAEIRETGASKELFTRPWQPFGEWIRSNIPDSSVIASTFKELSIFIGDRKILEVNYGVPLPMFERFLRDYGVQYVLSAGDQENIRPYEFVMKESTRYWFEPVHSQLGLTLYRVHSTWIERPPAELTGAHVKVDSTSPHGLLDLGRAMILRGEYRQALDYLSAAGNKGVYPSLVAYEMTVAAAMSYQQSEAGRLFQQLYTLPQSTSYIPAARLHLQALDTYTNAVKMSNMVQRSTELFNVAAFYWNFGYYRQATSLLQNILHDDTTFFVGLLWGWDYEMQAGNPAQAAKYLRTLESIDRSNAVVSGYRSLTAMADTLGRTKDAQQRSRLRLESARVYWDIGLFDESFDCVFRAIGEDPHSLPAYRQLTDLYRKTDKPWGVRMSEQMISARHLVPMEGHPVSQ